MSSSRPQYLLGYKVRLPSPYCCQPWPLRVATIYSSRPRLDLMGSLEFLVVPLSHTSCTITCHCQYDTLLQYPCYTSPGLHASYLSPYVPLLSLSLYLTSTSTNALIVSCYHVPLHTINKSFSYYLGLLKFSSVQFSSGPPQPKPEPEPELNLVELVQ